MGLTAIGAALVTDWRRRHHDPIFSYAHAAVVPIGGGSDLSFDDVATPDDKPGLLQSMFGRVEEDADGLCSLVARRSLSRIDELLQQGDSKPPTKLMVNLYGKAGVTPLMVAASNGDVELIKKLLDADADPDMPGSANPKKDNTFLIRQQSISQSAKVHLAAEWAKYVADVAQGALTTQRSEESYWRCYFNFRVGDPTAFKAVDFALLSNQLAAAQLLLERGAAMPSDVSVQQAAKRQAGQNADKDEIEKARRNLMVQLEHARQKAEDFKRTQRSKFPLEHRLSESIVGQKHAIGIVSSSIRRKENGWVDSDSPLVMLFMGSSGIGKTETAKLIAKYMFETEEKGLSKTLQRQQQKEDEARKEKEQENKQGFIILRPPGMGKDKKKDAEEEDPKPLWQKCFIRMDMTEFQSKHEVSKFIGAPPGYVGYDEGGQLVSKLKECPNGIVLLDEVEKAHPDVLTVMLQAFDEGRLTDGQGQTVDCREATFIMTSNLAQQQIADEAVRLREAVVKSGGQSISTVDGLTKKFKRNVVQPILRRHFGRDEFLGRINEIVFFLPFTFEEQEQLAAKELEKWAKRAMERHRIELKWTPRVVEEMARGYDLRYGARSIKYEIDRTCIATIARAQEEGQVTRGCRVSLDLDEKLLKQRQRAQEAAKKSSKDGAKKKKPAAAPDTHEIEAEDAIDWLGEDIDEEIGGEGSELSVPIKLTVTPNIVPELREGKKGLFGGLFGR